MSDAFDGSNSPGEDAQLPDIFAGQDAGAPSAGQDVADEYLDGPPRGSILSIVEEIIVGIVGFVSGFIATVFRFTFKPRRALDHFEPGARRTGWPEPYTYLAVSMFLFFQLVRTRVFEKIAHAGVHGIGDLSLSGFERQISDFSIERFFLSTLPAVVIAIFIGSSMTALAGERDARRRAAALRITAYAFGTQVMVFLALIYALLAIALWLDPRDTAEILVLVPMGILGICGALLPTLTLSRWFSRTEPRRGLFGPAALRFVVVAVFGAMMIGSLFGLSKYLVDEEDDVTVEAVRWYDKRHDDENVFIEMDVVLNNCSESRYVILGEAQVRIFYVTWETYDAFNNETAEEEREATIYMKVHHLYGKVSTRVGAHDMGAVTCKGEIPLAEYDPRKDYVRRAEIELAVLHLDKGGAVETKLVKGTSVEVGRRRWPVVTAFEYPTKEEPAADETAAEQPAAKEPASSEP